MGVSLAESDWMSSGGCTVARMGYEVRLVRADATPIAVVAEATSWAEFPTRWKGMLVEGLAAADQAIAAWCGAHGRRGMEMRHEPLAEPTDIH
jgi:hypothetical protein